jgi:hypothetical protein
MLNKLSSLQTFSLKSIVVDFCDVETLAEAKARHGVMDVVPPGTSPSKTLLLYLFLTSHPLAQVQQPKQLLHAKKRNIHIIHPTTFSSHSHLELLDRSTLLVVIFSPCCVIVCLLSQMTLVNLFFFCNFSLCLFSASILFVFVTLLGTCRHNFLTNRDAHRR